MEPPAVEVQKMVVEAYSTGVYYYVNLNEYADDITIVLKNDFTNRIEKVTQSDIDGYFENLAPNMRYTFLVKQGNYVIAEKSIVTKETSQRDGYKEDYNNYPSEDYSDEDYSSEDDPNEGDVNEDYSNEENSNNDYSDQESLDNDYPADDYSDDDYNKDYSGEDYSDEENSNNNYIDDDNKEDDNQENPSNGDNITGRDNNNNSNSNQN